MLRNPSGSEAGNAGAVLRSLRFRASAGGIYGNVGRNTATGPGFADLDLTLVKVLSVTERFKVDFRAEFFNILNRANFGLPSPATFSSNGQNAGSAGAVTSTVSTSRQMQFGLKLFF